MMEKQFTFGTIKAAPSTEFDGTFVLNEESSDRTGDVLEINGWELGNFKKNPIALWQHDHERPIGTWSNVRAEGNRLIGQLKLAGTSLAQMAKQLIQENVLRAVSVGLLPKEWEEIKDDKKRFVGYRVTKAELLEVSLVSVPAHPNALLLSKSLGLSAADRRLIFASSLHAGTSAKSGKITAIREAEKALRATRLVLRNVQS